MRLLFDNLSLLIGALLKIGVRQGVAPPALCILKQLTQRLPAPTRLKSRRAGDPGSRWANFATRLRRWVESKTACHTTLTPLLFPESRSRGFALYRGRESPERIRPSR